MTRIAPSCCTGRDPKAPRPAHAAMCHSYACSFGTSRSGPPGHPTFGDISCSPSVELSDVRLAATNIPIDVPRPVGRIFGIGIARPTAPGAMDATRVHEWWRDSLLRLSSSTSGGRRGAHRMHARSSGIGDVLSAIPCPPQQSLLDCCLLGYGWFLLLTGVLRCSNIWGIVFRGLCVCEVVEGCQKTADWALSDVE